MGLLKTIFAHPLTRGLSVDDQQTTLLRRRIIRDKPFLTQLYTEWYTRIVNALNHKTDVLELGSGAGFLAEILPGIITSEVFMTPHVHIVADARRLPFPAQSLDAIVMTDVFHHIPDVSGFMREASRCVRPGGKILMVEPWRTCWSEWIYTRLHPEPFDPQAGWELPQGGPLSAANGALPWIVFKRDRKQFESGHPGWRINRIEPIMPLAYLLSGGVSMRALMPGWMYRPVRVLERMLFQPAWAMFALIELEHLPDGFNQTPDTAS